MALCVGLLFVVCLGSFITTQSVADVLRPGQAKKTHSCDSVRPITDEMRTPEQNRPGMNKTFYKKYTEAYGIPIVGSDSVSDDALQRACYVVRFAFAGHSGIRATYHKLGGRITIMSETEKITDVPEYSKRSEWWNSRARGLSGGFGLSITSGAEENLLCKTSDKHGEEDNFLHVLGHTLDFIGGLTIPGYPEIRKYTFQSARKQGLWGKTYAGRSMYEYMAEGIQSYFDVNREGQPGGTGVHNDINTRDELKTYDPALFRLIQQLFPCDNTYLKRCSSTRAQEQGQDLTQDCNTESQGLPVFMTNRKCEDRKAVQCINWYLRGECEKAHQSMAYYCRGICNFCEN